MKIDWNDAYRVGDDRIDLQHQKLFALANEVTEAQSLSTVRLNFMYLYEYVREHFTDEEALMRNSGYARLKVHVLQHEALISRLNAISSSVGKGKVDLPEIEAFMNQWMLNHIAQEDTQLAAHLQQ
jgi:hemerythrin